MFESITVKAPCKINIGLQVFPKRQDGYHSIKSFFTTVDLFDEITVSPSEKNDVCNVECIGMDLPKDNTFTNAYKAFCVLSGNHYGVDVKVKKGIPSGGGLGGGSSDASSFIQSIDILFGTKLSSQKLIDLGGQIGSDVFFFSNALAYSQGQSSFAALVEGRGEIVRPVEPFHDIYVVMVFPEVSVSTKQAYSLVDGFMEKNDRSGIHDFDWIAELDSPMEQWRFRNDFTVPVCSMYKRVADALTDISNSGAIYTDLSGSGSTVFGLFNSKQQAFLAKEKLGAKWKTHFCKI